MDNDKPMDITDFPKEIVKDMYAIVEYKGTEKESFLYAYPSEIEAYKAAKRVSHNNVSVFKTNIVFHIVDGMKIMYGYEKD
ncbi:hypothetical protein [Clostridium chromiireducens]|uniref:Uncharacterized protein n=1 Tax=Clostridium chromiireducens TaxID=225345 RepID=A0A1V4I5I3_9CLOT|nr:hypothetical protein [Clostridium chromiireducens]OPJ55203.1 hypothetical protein CLCHR_47080 [Clostridium chromiireducens]